GCSRRWLGCSLGVTRASRVGRRQHRLQVGQQWAGSLESGEYVELLTCFVELSRANQAIHESRLSAAQASLTSDGYFESRDDRTPVGVRVAHVQHRRDVSRIGFVGKPRRLLDEGARGRDLPLNAQSVD